MALLFVLLVYGVWEVLREYRNTIIWAVLCSIALRGCKDWLVLHCLSMLQQDRQAHHLGSIKGRQNHSIVGSTHEDMEVRHSGVGSRGPRGEGALPFEPLYHHPSAVFHLNDMRSLGEIHSRSFCLESAESVALSCRTLFQLGLKVLFLPFSVVRSGAQDSWEFMKRWQRYALEYESTDKERHRLATDVSASGAVTAPPQGELHSILLFNSAMHP